MAHTNGLGIQISLDLYGCKNNEILNNKDKVTKMLEEAVRRAKAHVLNIYVHTFSPYGITGVAAISESHIAIHTWPEHAFAAIDVFTCGDRAMPELAVEYIMDILKPEKAVTKPLKRGTDINDEKTAVSTFEESYLGIAEERPDTEQLSIA